MATNLKLENARKFPSHRFAFHLAALVEIGVEYFKNLIFHSIALCSLVIRLSRLDRHEYCVSETFEKIPTSDCVVEEAIFSAHGPRHESCYQHSKCVLLKSNNFVNSARLPLAASVISQVIIKKILLTKHSLEIVVSQVYASRRSSSLCNLICRGN